MLYFPSHNGRRPKIHFSGIGGTGMVAGARLAVEAGWDVRGSDNPLYPPTSEMVKALACPVATAYAADNLDWNPDFVVVGNALSRGNPEVEAVLERKLHYVSLSEWLKEAVLRPRKPIVIAGTHGKTTTTTLTAYLLDRAGLDPGFFIGGQPLDFPHSSRLGAEGRPFVIEGDEYDTAFFDKRAKFFHYMPEIAVVTYVEFDHGDIYRDIEEIQRAFRWMLRQIPASGWLVACAEGKGSLGLKEGAPCNVLTYGFADSVDFRGEIGQSRSGLQEMTVFKHGRRWGDVRVPLAGRHNLLNTLAALAVGDLLGIPAAALAESLPAFRGVRRRMEVFHQSRGVTFVDDFGHHPTAIRETIAAAHMRWPGQRLWAVFEPRSNTTVTNRFQDDIRVALQTADRVWIGPIHRPEKIAPEERLDRAGLSRNLTAAGVPAAFTDNVEDIVRDLAAEAREGDVVLILSNGAFGSIYDRLRTAFN